ncbi:MAG: HIT family protein [Caulobacteraceae bacterium]|nr:HIT family protein [Caulobacteraceae bacterium]
MSLLGEYDPDNIFAKITRGDLPAARIFEDHDTLAFMDAFPQSRGHALVIHKRAHARNLLEIEPEPLQALILSVQRVTRAMVAALKPDGVVVTQFNGRPAGQTVFHLHFHVVPRWEGVPLGRHAGGGAADPAELAELARQIAAEIS